MRLILTHITHGQQNPETVTVEGDNYDRLLLEALTLIPEGRIGASIRVER